MKGEIIANSVVNTLEEYNLGDENQLTLDFPHTLNLRNFGEQFHSNQQNL